MLTEPDLRGHIQAFAATISLQPLGLARHCPEEWGQPMKCFENVMRKVQQDGGGVKFGWMFHHRHVIDIPGPGYLIAVHHAVWHASNGQLIDGTPFHSNPKHHPLAPGGDVLFLVDDRARPIITDTLIAPLPSRFRSLSDDERLVNHVQRLRREEEQECRQMMSAEGI